MERRVVANILLFFLVVVSLPFLLPALLILWAGVCVDSWGEKED